MSVDALEKLAERQAQEFETFKAEIESPGKRLEETRRTIRRKKTVAALNSGDPATIRQTLAKVPDEDKPIVAEATALLAAELEKQKKEAHGAGAKLLTKAAFVAGCLSQLKACEQAVRESFAEPTVVQFDDAIDI